MRIERLDLVRFGIFTDRTLDLSSPGMHVVVGANEAGKSTAMRAIRQLFFGIPTRTTDAFIHQMPDLRVAARLVGDGEEPLEIVRLKKLKDSLRDPADDPIDPNVLARRLHNTSEQIFGNLFTISHDEITAGGEALLHDEGEVGAAIFSAGRGTTALTAVLRELEAQASHLFKSGGQKPALNSAIARYKEHRAESTRLSSPPKSVVDLDNKIERATRARQTSSIERNELVARRSLLEEVRNNRPHLATRVDHLTRLNELGDAGPLIDTALADALAAARGSRQDAQSALRSAESNLARRTQDLAGLRVDSELLGQSEVIEHLQEEVGGYRQNNEDLPGRRTKATTVTEDLETLRRELPDGRLLDDGGRPMLSVDQSLRVGELSRSWPQLEAALESANTELAMVESRLGALTTRLGLVPAPLDVAALSEVCTRIRAEGPLESNLTTDKSQLGALEAGLRQDLSYLGLIGIGASEVASLPVPRLDSLRKVRADKAKNEERIESARDEITELERRLSDASTDLEALMAGQQPPNIDDLDTARSHRQRGWELVLGAWLDGDDLDSDVVTAWTDGAPLGSAYERAVTMADNVADRLRTDAEAVTRRSTLEKLVAETEADLKDAESALTELINQSAELDASWSDLWDPLGISAVFAEAIDDWHDGFRGCLRKAADVAKAERAVTGLHTTIERHRHDVKGSLTIVGIHPPPDLSLLGLLDHAKDAIEQSSVAAASRAELDKAVRDSALELDKRKTDLDAAATNMRVWEHAWKVAVAAIALEATATPAMADAVLATLTSIKTKATELADLKGRVIGIEERNDKFSKALATVLSGLTDHGDLTDLDPDTAVKMLARRLADAQAESTRRAAILDQIKEHEESAGDANQRLADAQATIDEMVRVASLADEAALADAIIRSVEHAELATDIAQIEQKLRDSTGKSMNQIESEAAEIECVDISSDLSDLETRIEEMEGVLENQSVLLGELHKEHSLVDSSGKAADCSLEAEQALSEVVTHAEEYVRVVLARRLLEEQVIAYRDQNQGPLLARAKELFRSLTLDRYIGIDTDTDNKGNPFIVAQSANQSRVAVDKLSTGTRDQLYLALRLAALEQYMDRNGPLPLVLDDLLVHFDDGRTKAGLGVLDKLSDRTQVLLFTHHEHVAEHASEVVPDGRLTIHRMGY